MTSGEKIVAAKKYLRRKYQNNVQGLKELADKVATDAFEAVTITGNAYEGGSAQGVLVFSSIEYLGAIEDLIAEFDPEVPQPDPMIIYSDFSSRPVQT